MPGRVAANSRCGARKKDADWVVTEADSSSAIGSAVPGACQGRIRDDRKTWPALLLLILLRVSFLRVSHRLSVDAESVCSACKTTAILLPALPYACGRLSAQQRSHPDSDSSGRWAPGVGGAVAHRLICQPIHCGFLLVRGVALSVDLGALLFVSHCASPCPLRSTL